jgi:ribulose 1,5-bisphosphate synthetase/thiazole synthase
LRQSYQGSTVQKNEISISGGRMKNNSSFDYDFIIIGSGFGGSVSALRLAEKGYKVAMLEKGKLWKEGSPAMHAQHECYASRGFCERPVIV